MRLRSPEVRARAVFPAPAPAALAYGVDEPRVRPFPQDVPPGGSLDPQLTGASAPGDGLAVATRNLRTMISTARLENGRTPKLIVLLSAQADPETALTAGNLAIASARSGWRTLLVDANGADPIQSTLFRVEQRPVDANLHGVVELGAFVQPTPVQDLMLLAVGAAPQPPEAGAGADLNHAIGALVDEFDLVLVDASHNSTDCALSAGADAAIIVLRRDHSTAGCVADMVHRLDVQGTPLLGTFLVA